MKNLTSGTIFLIIILVIAWVFLLRPTTLGGPTTYIIVSGKSMVPTMQDGDLAVTRAKSEYRVGDIVAFHAEGGVVMHRIIGGTEETGFITRGDGNTWNDPWTIASQDIVGRRWFYIPGGGKFLLNILNSLRQPLYLGVFAACLTAIFIACGGMFAKARRNRRTLREQRRKYFHSVVRNHWL